MDNVITRADRRRQATRRAIRRHWPIRIDDDGIWVWETEIPGFVLLSRQVS